MSASSGVSGGRGRLGEVGADRDQGSSEALEARDIHVRFGSVAAVTGVDLALNKGETLGVIGPNGAGKTTLVNAMTGFVDLTEGSVFLDGDEVSALKPFVLARRGVVRTFQGVRIFRDLTVFQNAEVGSLGMGVGRRLSRKRAEEALEAVDLIKSRFDRARVLPHGAQRRLELARAFAMQPYYLLLDEPAAGLSERESDSLMDSIRGFQAGSGAGVLLIEHDMRVIMGLCDRIQVLDFGRTITVGRPAAVRADAEVIAAYLGAADEGTVEVRHAQG